MPTYNYKCFTCGYEFELFLPIYYRYKPTEEPCPKCKDVSNVQKMVDKVNFKVKGACAKNGYSSNIGDAEKFMGREFTMDDLDD